MLSSDLIKVIHQIEFKTKKILSGPLSGDFRSKLKGQGFNFEQLREYQQGDDVRYIDFKSSARANQLLVKQYLEDRNRTVYIISDISASTFYSTKDELKSDLVKQLSAMLAFTALHRKDSVGLILFSDQIEVHYPPKPTKEHVYKIVKTLLTYQPKSVKTDYKPALELIAKLKSKRALIFFVSDFLSYLDKSLLNIAIKHNEIIAFRCIDERELDFADVGILNFNDKETGKQIVLDTSDKKINEILNAFKKDQDAILKKAKIDCFDAYTSKNFFSDLVRFLKQRIVY